MKTIRKDWPRVRQYVKGGNFYYQVDLRRKHHRGQKWRNFTTRDEALHYGEIISSVPESMGEVVIEAGSAVVDFLTPLIPTFGE